MGEHPGDVLLLTLIACAPCTSTDPVRRDACLQEKVVASPTVAAVRVWLDQIQDPLARDVAILLWVDTNRATGGREGEELCRSLSVTSEQATCLRRFSAAHLNR